MFITSFQLRIASQNPRTPLLYEHKVVDKKKKKQSY